DFAADLRAPTPTAAAEMAVPVRVELLQRLADARSRLLSAASRTLENKSLRARNIWARARNPQQLLIEASQRLDDKFARLALATKNRLKTLGEKLNFAGKMLASFSPDNVLERGYAMVLSKDGEVVQTAAALAKLSSARVKFKDGEVPVSTTHQPSLF
ncbi:MAG: hypothetical protein LBL52_02660, partial [Rickettsiales bacterium]|nr:hypothetical protein [Rickettsiales bacterium]